MASGIIALCLLVGTVGFGLVLIAKTEQQNLTEPSADTQEPVSQSLAS